MAEMRISATVARNRAGRVRVMSVLSRQVDRHGALPRTQTPYPWRTPVYSGNRCGGREGHLPRSNVLTQFESNTPRRHGGTEATFQIPVPLSSSWRFENQFSVSPRLRGESRPQSGHGINASRLAGGEVGG